MIPVPRNQNEASKLKKYYIGSRPNQIPLPNHNLVKKFLKDNFNPRRRWFGFNETRSLSKYRKIYPSNVVTSQVHNDDLLIQILDYENDLRWFIHIPKKELDHFDPKCDVSLFNTELTILMENKLFGDLVPELKNMSKVIEKLK